ncbi:hypothetical protein [Amnibacterium sp.]|uniref:hypothetical protein n=1 Tax=Amnibacterium sp. TaxID=1872496 RepID=UPI002629A2FE|nr:hypothetical protein [Amnibacterium sp.]MCU1474138.1 hypothetical protein [Amnibacterium sp.]
MSTALERTELQVAMPAGWYAMPDPEAPGAPAWPYEMVGRLGFEGQDAVSAVVSLADALDRARAQARPRRLRWVFLGEPPVAVVQAWARLDVVPRLQPDGRTASDTWERGVRNAPHAGEAAVWHREVARRTVHGDPAVTIHDLLTVRSAPDASGTVQHRTVVTMFPAEPIVVSLSVSTPLLAALPDVEATALEIANGIRLGEPS